MLPPRITGDSLSLLDLPFNMIALSETKIMGTLFLMSLPGYTIQLQQNLI